MFFAPAIVNRIGAKNALLAAGVIMSARILGSSFASSAVEVVILKMLHMFELPFLLVGTFKYISSDESKIDARVPDSSQPAKRFRGGTVGVAGRL
jgi:oligosaccharide:H+ symporter